MNVFIATAFANREQARTVAKWLADKGLRVCSRWHDDEGDEGGQDWFQTLPPKRVRAINASNDEDLASAHVVLMIGAIGGGESYAEVERARGWNIPVVWTGRATTSVYRDGVHYMAEMVDAVDLLLAAKESVGRPWPTVDEWARETTRRFFARVAEPKGGA